MKRNDAEGFAQRLYARVPGHYRGYDTERGQPLLALLRIVGEQMATVRQDMDALWDDFFIETCDDWVIPYLGALVGAKLLPQPVDQRSNRLDVWNTVLWRRSKGTMPMLAALSQPISGWSADIAEFFQILGWSQNMNHVRLDRPLNPDLRDPYKLSLLGHAADPLAHALDFKPAGALDQTRTIRTSPRIGAAAWATPGRYQVKNLGVFVRRLRTFPVEGATPASAPPGAISPPTASAFTFNPLFREMQLFVAQTGAALTRPAFAQAPWKSFGSDVAVRQFGVLLASEVEPLPKLTSSPRAFTFGGANSIALHTSAGMRLLQPRSFQPGAAHFLITALWKRTSGQPVTLGMLSTFSNSFFSMAAATGPGQLVVTVRTGRPGLGWPGPPLPTSPAARFPGATLAVRAARTGAVHSADGLYVYLPPAFVTPGNTPAYYAADDGSTYLGDGAITFTGLDLSSLPPARSSEGQTYPSRITRPSTHPAAAAVTRLNRMPGGLRLADPARFGGVGVLFQLALFPQCLDPQQSKDAQLGAIATIAQSASAHPDLKVPDPWPAFTNGPSKSAVDGPGQSSAAGQSQPPGLLSVLVKPLNGNFIPAAELVLVNRRGQSLLVALPEVLNAPANGIRYLVADDGSTYFATTAEAIQQGSYGGLALARAAQGQVLPIPGIWPLQQRRPVAIDLCRSERGSLLAPGELGIDPELGRFALPAQDPAIGQGGLSVDYVEAFSDRVGALGFEKPNGLATRLVSQSGDVESLTALPGAPVHSSLTDAIAKAKDGEVIEIVDSATYAAPAGVNIASLQNLTIRAVGQRPCLTFYSAPNTPAPASFTVAAPMSRLILSGLLVSGGPLRIKSLVRELCLTACTLDPRTAVVGSLFATGAGSTEGAHYFLGRSITGGLRIGAGVAQLTVADSIIDQQHGSAIAGVSDLSSPPGPLHSPPHVPAPVAGIVQLERVTVLGLILCEVLSASECLLNDVALVQDQQSGCVRFTCFERGSVLPRRYQCVPSESQTAACSERWRRLSPVFNSRRFGRPDYAQLAAACPSEILRASEAGAEVGAFAAALNTIRLGNLRTKLQEFMPVGMSALIVAET
jgi:hypothetical protein